MHFGSHLCSASISFRITEFKIGCSNSLFFLPVPTARGRRSLVSVVPEEQSKILFDGITIISGKSSFIPTFNCKACLGCALGGYPSLLENCSGCGQSTFDFLSRGTLNIDPDVHVGILSNLASPVNKKRTRESRSS